MKINKLASLGRLFATAIHLSPVLVGAILPAMASGSVAAETETQTLPETVVTATRYAIPAETVGSSVTAITDEELREKQTRFVSDILRDVPGLAVNRSGTFGTLTQVRIRGAEGNQTLVIIDGVKMNDPASGDEFDFSTLLASDIERIEVLRGPQATLYGSNTVGGVINITTKQGEPGLRGSARLEGGSFGTFDGGASIGGGTDLVNGHLGLSGLRTDGINISRFGDEEDGYSNITLNGRVGFNPLDNLDVQGSLRYVDTSLQFDDFGAETLSGTDIIIPNDADEESEDTRLSGRVQGKLTVLDGKWDHRVGFSGLKTTNDSFTDGEKTFFFDGNKTILDYQSNLFLETPTIAQATHVLTFLIEHQNQDGENVQGDLPEIENTGFVGEYRVGLWDRFFVTGGARYDDNSEFEGFTSPRVTAAYLHRETATRLHGSWGKGVQNPTLTELFGFFATFVGNPDLEPENSEGWDVGVEQSFFSGRVVGDVTYFDNQIQDFISSEFVPTLGKSRPINLPGTSTDRSSNRIEGCVEQYDPRVDYFPEEARVRHATGFTIEYRRHYKIVTVLTPWPEAEEHFRYILLQCGTPRPTGFDEAQFIEVPIDTIATLSTTHLPHLELLDEVESLVAMSTPDRVYSMRIQERVKAGEVQAVGRGASLNIERVLELAPELVTAVGHDQPQYNAHPVLERAGVHVAINGEYVEESALGRAEWLKFTAAFFNKESAAERLFSEMEKQYERYAALTQPIAAEQRPTVFGGALYRDTWYVSGGKSYIARLIQDAGGRYLWAEDTHRASVPLSFEAVFERAATADYWFTGRLEWLTRADVLAANERYASFKAFREGHVYNNNARVNQQAANDYWETGIVEPHILLADLIKILHPELLANHRLRYYRRLK